MRKRAKRRGDAFGDPSADGIEFMTEGRDNDYAASVDKGHKVDPRAQKIFILAIVLVVLYFIGLIVPKNIGNVMFSLQHNLASGGQYSLSILVNDLQKNVADLVAVFTGHGNLTNSGFTSAMLRYIIVALTGAGLAICGAVYQGSFGNALVSPSTLGVMSGGSFGLMVWVVLFMDQGVGLAWMSGALSDNGITAPEGFFGYLSSSGGAAILSFLGCLIVVGLVLSLLATVLSGSIRNIGHVFAAVFCAALPFAALIVYTLPYRATARTLQPKGLALAGWSGASDIGQSKNLIVTDRDLFPDGSVEDRKSVV